MVANCNPDVAVASNDSQIDGAPLWGKFRGIRQQVCQNLIEPHRVAAHERCPDLIVEAKNDAILRRIGPVRFDRLVCQCGDVNVAKVELHLAGFGLADVQKVIDHQLQLVGISLRDIEERRDLVGQQSSQSIANQRE